MNFFLLFLIPIGFLIGAYGTLIGVGGGFLLIPFLLFAYPLEPSEKITSISLSVIFFNSFSGTISYSKMGRVNFKTGLFFALSSIPGSIAGAYTTPFIPRRLFELIFGFFLISSAIIINLKKHQNNFKTNDTNKTEPAIILKGSILSLFIGFISSLLGVAGGIFHVPFLIYLLKFPIRIATATSHFILAVTSFFASFTHLLKGSLKGEELKIIFLSLGIIPGAQVGALLSKIISEKWIIRALTLAIFILGIRIIFMSVS
ncbi:MAG: sulfite exporter TauE/SafE family protein [Candidatus Aminicenantia bacterium]